MRAWFSALLSPQTWCWHPHRIRERRPDGQLLLVCERCLHTVAVGVR